MGAECNALERCANVITRDINELLRSHPLDGNIVLVRRVADFGYRIRMSH